MASLWLETTKNNSFVYSHLPNIQIPFSRRVDMKEIRIKREVQRHIETNQAPLLSFQSQFARQEKKPNLIILYVPLFVAENIIFCFQIPNPTSKGWKFPKTKGTQRMNMPLILGNFKNEFCAME